MRHFLLSVSFTLWPVLAWAQLAAFPGAEGAGSATRHAFACGSDPVVVKVTNLNDSGAGSLRNAIQVVTGPRIVVFETSGTIVLTTTDIYTTEDCLWVAGQTAPSPGIQIRGHATSCPQSCGGLQIFADNVLLEHLRIRPGDGLPVLSSNAAHDAVLIGGIDEKGRDVVLKHLTLQWAANKAIQWVTTSGQTNLLIWRTMVAECLYYADNQTFIPENPASGFGWHWNTGEPSDQDAAAIGNLFSHCNHRLPEIGFTDQRLNWVNNIVYDAGNDGLVGGATQFSTVYSYGYGELNWFANWIGNKYITRNPSPPVTPLYGLYVYNAGANAELYFSDNCKDDALEPLTLYDFGSSFDPTQGTPATGVTPPTTIQSCSSVESWVGSRVGARPADRDAAETRILTQLTNRTGAQITDPDDETPGYPTYAANTIDHDAGTHPKPSSTATDTDSDGYKDIEEWLHSYACEVEGGSNCWGTGVIVSSAWTTDQGGSGTCTGTTAFSCSNIPLVYNVITTITVTTTDNDANTGTDTLQVMAVPVPGTPLDLYDRVNWPGPGPNWITLTANIPTVSNNLLVTALNDHYYLRWNAHTLNADQCATVKIHTIGGSQANGVAVRMSADTGANRDMYRVWTNGSANTVLIKEVNSVVTILQEFPSTPWAFGDLMTLCVTGSSPAALTLYRTPAGGGSAAGVGGVYSDSSSPLTTGQPGVYQSGVGAQSDDFSAVNANPGADEVPPTVIITSPTNASTLLTGVASLDAAGTCEDNIGGSGVAVVTWSTQTQSGTASGTTAWTIANIAIPTGAIPTVLSVVCVDIDGNESTPDILTITRAAFREGKHPLRNR